MRRTAFLGILLLVVACGGESDPTANEPPPPTVSGAWSGSTTFDSQAITLQLTLLESALGVVTGSGSLSITGFAAALSVHTGTHVFPNLSLTLREPGFDDINLTGTVSATSIVATITGSGFVGLVFNMTK